MTHSYIAQPKLNTIFLILVEGLTYLGSFSNHLHGISGDMYSIDGIDNQLHIRRFKYDGTGTDTFFWAGTKGTNPDSDGFVMEYPFKGQFYSYDDHNVPVLPEFTGNEEPIVLTLPKDIKIDDLMWISVWDRTWSTSFGEVKQCPDNALGLRKQLNAWPGHRGRSTCPNLL